MSLKRQQHSAFSRTGIRPKSYSKTGSACDASPIEGQVKKPRLIAIVDDEKAVCRAISRLVISAGLEAEIFPSAEEFLRSFRERRPDCLILDIRLPGLSGT